MAKALGLSEIKGVLVLDIASASPSGRAGIRRGDLIVSLDGVKIKSLEHLFQLVEKVSAGETVPIIVSRKGMHRQLTLPTIAWPPARRISKGEFANIPPIGLTVASLTPKVRDAFGIRWETVGVVVSIVDPDKPAERILRRGEVIRQINQETVWSPDQVTALYQDAKKRGQESLLALVEGKDGFRFALIPVR